MRAILAGAILALCFSVSATTTNLVDGAFTNGLAEWHPLWSREAGVGNAHLEKSTNNLNVVVIEHRGPNDWSLEPNLQLSVKPGDIFQLDAAVKVEGSGNASVCVSTWDVQNQNVSWSYGEQTVGESKNWQEVHGRFVVPPGVVRIQPRFIGDGPATIRMTGYSLAELPGIETLRPKSLAQRLAVTNAFLDVAVDTSNATISVLDHRTGRQWSQTATHSDLIITGAQSKGRQVDLKLLDVASGLDLSAVLVLEKDQPEFTFKVFGKGRLAAPLRFPFPFTSQPGDRLIVPMNEGISYPVEDKSIETFRLIAYGGHGICMSFWGVTDDRQGHEVIIETPDDAAIQLRRSDERLIIAPEWDSQKGSFGYARQLRYVFFDKGGYVAMAKRYRSYARQIGRFKTLAQKREENPNVDLLIGAVNVWNWDADPVALTKEMQAAGIEHILWSRGGSPEALKTLNDMKVLTSRYDIYQDIMDPANFPALRWTHGDWVAAAWPKEIIIRGDGDWLRGWGVEGKSNDWYSCGVLCDKFGPKYASQRIPADLAKNPYKCRFIDTTTASPWNECYSPDHPMTRSESRAWKMRLLNYVSHDAKQVTGCETGHDASVPYLHYFEGMLSLGPYRVPDAGRAMERIWTNAPEVVAKFQLGQAYRLPLWELVYHDCVVAQWYWGDYNNKIPSLWDKRDLFNVLYGTPPMFMLTRAMWNSQKERFVQSYRNTCSYVRAAGYSEMTDHRILTTDRNVQQSVFANGVVVTVNFGTTPYRLSSGDLVNPGGFRVDGMKE